MTDAGFVIPPKLYDFLKFIAFVILPGLATLFLALVPLLHWDAGALAAGIATALDTFLGTVLGKSSKNYKEADPQAYGDLVFRTNENGEADVSRIEINRENPVFNVGSKVYLTVKREVEQK